MMSLDQAIAQYEQFANVCEHHGLTASQEEFEQLVAWLRELRECRKAPEIIRCGECVNQYKPTCPFGVWINTPDDGHCHWAERRTE